MSPREYFLILSFFLLLWRVPGRTDFPLFAAPTLRNSWNVAGCLNTLPLPFANKSDRPSYSTQLECCQKAYGGQSSGACVSMLAVPPTASPTTYPTEPGTLEQGYYADYTANPDWSIATCTNVSPKPNNGSPVYETKEKCCQGQYGGQMVSAGWDYRRNDYCTSSTRI